LRYSQKAIKKMVVPTMRMNVLTKLSADEERSYIAVKVPSKLYMKDSTRLSQPTRDMVIYEKAT